MNTRMWVLLSICVVITLIITNGLIQGAKAQAQPEPTINIVRFTMNLPVDTVVEKPNVELYPMPISAIPEGVVTNLTDVIGKRVTTGVLKHEPVMKMRLIDRGTERVNTDDLFQISLDIPDISNYLGVQLQLGELYALYHNEEGLMPVYVDLVKIIDIVDTTGKKMIEGGTGTVKSVIVGVDSEAVAMDISDGKENGRFEIIKPTTRFIDSIKYKKKEIMEFDYYAQELLEKSWIIKERIRQKEKEVIESGTAQISGSGD